MYILYLPYRKSRLGMESGTCNPFSSSPCTLFSAAFSLFLVLFVFGYSGKEKKKKKEKMKRLNKDMVG